MLTFEDCDRFEKCDAPICPLDPDKHLRVWYSDEEVCKSQTHNKHRWIKKQRSIQRRQTKTWLGHPVFFQELYDASRPGNKKELTEEEKKKVAERFAKYREKKKGNQNKE